MNDNNSDAMHVAKAVMRAAMHAAEQLPIQPPEKAVAVDLGMQLAVWAAMANRYGAARAAEMMRATIDHLEAKARG